LAPSWYLSYFPSPLPFSPLSTSLTFFPIFLLLYFPPYFSSSLSFLPSIQRKLDRSENKGNTIAFWSRDSCTQSLGSLSNETEELLVVHDMMYSEEWLNNQWNIVLPSWTYLHAWPLCWT
jgi:hypothetical protein